MTGASASKEGERAPSSVLEVEFWKYLVSDTGLSLKQHTPEIGLFTNRCDFALWAYSSPKGLLKSKSKSELKVD